MRACLVLVLASLAALVAAPVPGAAQPPDCSLSYPPKGEIDVEYTRLLRADGPLKCPMALEEPVLDREGAFQEFQRGQIGWSPQSGNPHGVQAAYYKPDCTPDGDCIVFRWWNMPESDVWQVRLADTDHAGIVPEEAREGALEIVAQTTSLEFADAEDKAFDAKARVFLSPDETMSRTAGAIGVRVNRYQAGRYKFVIQGCTRESGFLGIGTDTDCPHQWSNPVHVDYEFLDYNGIVNNWKADPALNEFYILHRRLQALGHACRRARGVEKGGAAGSVGMALLGTEPTPLLPLPPNTPPPFQCPRAADDLTDYDTKSNLAKLQAGDPVLGLVGGNCDAGLGPLPSTNAAVLKNECLMALALRDVKKTKEVGTDTYKDPPGIILDLAGAALGLISTLPFGAPIGFLAAELVNQIVDACGTHGDYDFDLQWIIRMMLVHGPTGTGGDNKIDERTWDHLLTLLTERGKGTFDRKAHFCGVPIPETENHIWMIESARYLANEILTRDAIWRGLTPDPTWDNAANGQRQLILEQLRRLLVEDFYEFNSRPYQYLAVFAIRNLYELTTFRQNPNDPVPRAAEIVLDYLSARYALSSNGLRRVANFRRQPHRARYGTMFQAIGDAEFARMALLAGGSLPLHLQRWGRVHPWEVGTIVFHGTGRPYRVPDTVRDYLVRGAEHRKPDDVLQRFRSRGGQDDGGLEIHFSTPSFLLSAGGVYVEARGGLGGELFSAEQSSPLPTAFLLSNAGRGWEEMIRFQGVPDQSRRFNTCVGPNFACGVDPKVPTTIPAACIVRQGKWTFFNFNSSTTDCYRPFGVHVALYTEPCTDQDCAYGGSSWGLLEAQETPIVSLPLGPALFAQEAAAFQAFQTAVVSNNAAFEPAWDQANFQNLYRTTKNRLIQFNPGPLGAQEWSVNHLDGVKTPEPKDWPVAQGDVMNAVFNQSCIEFDNHYRKTRLILDLRDLTKEPKRWKCEGPLIRYVLGSTSIDPPSCQMADPCP